jgi:hypothetical protein
MLTPKLKLFFLSLALVLGGLAPSHASASGTPFAPINSIRSNSRPRAHVANTDPEILFVNYLCGDPVIHIGSAITVYMAAVLPNPGVAPNQPISVSVSGTSSAANIVLTGPSLSSLPLCTLYVTDGYRVWSVPFPGGTSTFSFGDSQLVPQPAAAPFTVGNYNTLINSNFSVYAGTLITGFTGGAPAMNVDLGHFGNIVLADAGGSGVWSGVYNVPDLEFAVSGGRFFGDATVSGIEADNAPFQSAMSFSIDGVLPAIQVVQFTTSQPNYNGMMYIARSSQGNSTPNPTNSQGTFNVQVNKKNTFVDITIADPSTANKNLPTLVVPASSLNTNGTRIWDGTDGNNNFMADGVYTASLYIRDTNGVVGLTKTTQVRVISAKWSVGNISMNPSSLNLAQFVSNGTASIITTVQYNASLQTDNGTGLQSSLVVMGWQALGAYNSNVNMASTIWDVNDMAFLNPEGGVGISIGLGDADALFDNDASYVAQFECDNTNFNANALMPTCYLYCDLPGMYCGPAACTTNTYGKTVRVGDGNTSNDWTSNAFKEFSLSGPAGDPTLLSVTFSVQVQSATPPAVGSYRLDVRSTLGSITYSQASQPPSPNVQDYCVSFTATPVYFGLSYHFFPTTRPDPGYFPPNYGFGFYYEDHSAMFTVSNSAPSTSDTTPPVLLNTSPQPGSIIGPNVYGPNNVLSATVQDPETGISNNNSATYISVSYLLANGSTASVNGTSYTDGGGLNNITNIYFKPNSNLVIGGQYTMTINATNGAGLITNKTVQFTVQDTTPADVSQVELVSSSLSLPIQLTPFQSANTPDGPFNNIDEIRVALSVPSTTTNTIDWADSTVSLYQVSGTTQSAVNLKRLTSTAPGTVPTDGFLHYQVSPEITQAGLFLIVVQTFSKDASGNSYQGPDSNSAYITPEFTTSVNANSLILDYPNLVDQAVTGTQPITGTTTAGFVFNPSTNTTGIIIPNFAVLAGNTGFAALSGTAAQASAFQFVVTGPGPQVQPMTWNFSAGSPLQFSLYYNDSDMPAGVSHTSIELFGFNGTVWQPVTSNVVYTYTNITGNSFVLTVPTGTQFDSIYALFYPNNLPGTTPTAAPTAIPFKSTRSFDPTSSNALVRKAKFYYAPVVAGTQPRELDVKVYDTTGRTIRTLTLGNGVNLTDIDTDPNYGSAEYFLTWDGTNDTGNLVKNGIYLVRWRLTNGDGSTSNQTKVVALIK